MRAGIVLIIFGTVVAASGAAERPLAPPADAERVVRDAVAQAISVPDQAQTLVDLAWPDTPGDPAVAAKAREEILGYSEHAIGPLRRAILSVRPEHQADVVRALLQIFRALPARIPGEYLPAMEAAAWYGTVEARRVAISELARFKYRPALLTIMDSSYEFPELVVPCIEALGKIGDDHARFFLERHLNESKPQVSAAAASALAQIGGTAILPLKAALRSGSRSVRQNAAVAFLPVAGENDLSALHEYVTSHANDDAATVEAVRQATIMLEKLREAREAAAASSAKP